MALRHTAILTLSLASLLLSGCIGALVALPPLGASVLIGREVIEQRQRKRSPQEVKQAEAAVPEGVVVTDMTTLPPPSEGPSPIEDAEAIEQMRDYISEKVIARTKRFEETPAKASVVLMPGATLVKPSYTVCEDLPPALVVDLDTVTGATVPVSDALVEALETARDEGVKVIFISATSPKYANMIATDLMVAGLGNARREDTLWLVGDRGTTAKDGLLWKISSHACVVALAGGDVADFTPLLTPKAGAVPANKGLIGSGWFVLPQLQVRPN